MSNGAPAPEPTRPFSLRLSRRDIEMLRARAYCISGTVTGIARELIVTGLSGGDSQAVAERLMQIERRLVGLEGTTRDVGATVDSIEAAVAEVRAKFDALINALSAGEGTS